MSEQKAVFTVQNKLGMHARAASRLVQVTSRFPCEIEARRDDQTANAKSVMGVLLLCGAKGVKIEFTARGEQALDALTAIRQLFDDRFGEKE